jgi:hypothetical protein
MDMDLPGCIAAVPTECDDRRRSRYEIEDEFGQRHLEMRGKHYRVTSLASAKCSMFTLEMCRQVAIVAAI